jgi:uncharacterized protein (DUF362 family)
MKVSIVKCNDYKNCKEKIEKAIDLIGGLENNFEKVLIKPNVVLPVDSENGLNTHHLFVKAVIEILKERDIVPMVGDSSIGASYDSTEKSFKKSGIKDVIKETGAVYRNFEKEKFVLKKIPGAKFIGEVEFAEAVLEADFIINLPKLKVHPLTLYTGAIKNCFGCIKPKNRFKLHLKSKNKVDFINILVDIFSFVKPQLNIMDGVTAIETSKDFCHGKSKKVGLMLASRDGVSLDFVASKIIGYNPIDIPTTKNALERKISISSPAEIEIVGEKIKNVSVNDFQKYSVNDFWKLNTLLTLNKDNCKRCELCKRNCPTNAISMDPYPKFDFRKCNLCYCCLETCINNAIIPSHKFVP